MGLGTGSITDRPINIFRHFNANAKKVSLINGSGAAMVAGREVYLTADGTIAYRTTGTQVPIGIIATGAESGDLCSVLVYGDAFVSGVAKGGTLAVGDLVRQDGTAGANGSPNYIVVATAGHFVTGIVVDGATVGGSVEVLSLQSPIKF